MGIPEAPPDLMEQVKQALAAQAEEHELEHRSARSQLAQRRQVIAFAAVACTCRRWYDRDDPNPPQAGCVVHGALFVTLEGEVL